MPTTFRPYQPDQLLLLSPDLREWLPPGHLAHHVSDLVDALELRAFYAPYEGDGRRNAPYEPSMVVKVLIYAYATGVFSSRAIARKLEEDVAFRVLAAGNFPQHRTICEFRRRHLEDFERLFVEVVRVAREMGVVRFGTLSVDGTKVRANASKRKAMSYGRMLQEEARLKEEIEGAVGEGGRGRWRKRMNATARRCAVTNCLRSCNAGRSVWRRLRRRRRGWRRRNGRAMMRAGARPARAAIPREAGRTSAPMVSPSPRRRATSPTPRAGS